MRGSATVHMDVNAAGGATEDRYNVGSGSEYEQSPESALADNKGSAEWAWSASQVSRVCHDTPLHKDSLQIHPQFIKIEGEDKSENSTEQLEAQPDTLCGLEAEKGSRATESASKPRAKKRGFPTTNPDFEPLERPKGLITTQERSFLRQRARDTTPLEVFQQFLPNKILDALVDNTKDCAQLRGSENGRSWVPATRGEIKIFFEVFVYIGV